MSRRLVFAVVFAWACVGAPRAFASCGAECSCPVDQTGTSLDSRFLFDITQLYIDQDQPRVGADDALVGAIPSHHDEVRTVNRVTNFKATYRAAGGWTFGANVPYVDRTHEHIHHDLSEDEYERWNYSGLGDAELSVSRAIPSTSGPSFRVGFALKTPTGKQQAALTEGGDALEPSARIGTGSWDVLANLGAEWRSHAPGKADGTNMPFRVTLAGRYNGTGVEDYKHGAEAQLHVGTEYPVVKHLAALAQANYRVRAKDTVSAGDDEEESNTGGVAVYATPGLRYDAVPGFSLYGLAQFPLYERVNGIQVVARTNLVLGVTRSIF